MPPPPSPATIRPSPHPLPKCCKQPTAPGAPTQLGQGLGQGGLVAGPPYGPCRCCMGWGPPYQSPAPCPLPKCCKQPMPQGAPTQVVQGLVQMGVVGDPHVLPCRDAARPNMGPPYQSPWPHPLPTCCKQPMASDAQAQSLQLGPLLLLKAGCPCCLPWQMHQCSYDHETAGLPLF